MSARNLKASPANVKNFSSNIRRIIRGKKSNRRCFLFRLPQAMHRDVPKHFFTDSLVIPDFPKLSNSISACTVAGGDRINAKALWSKFLGHMAC